MNDAWQSWYEYCIACRKHANVRMLEGTKLAGTVLDVTNQRVTVLAVPVLGGRLTGLMSDH